ncbi:hypothetical protein T4B_991 [Trichinella pseudospiralis]|uniref:Uncharacterized protein n=1 Tax=Trichinella pseudospiralis TaxID=6337 RepID=A0A0V1HUL3_TRIPS|nr:hypothetical protein T4B_991 [Trichinella pseudospiralis]
MITKENLDACPSFINNSILFILFLIAPHQKANVVPRSLRVRPVGLHSAVYRPDIGVVSISVDNRGGLRHTIATRGRRTLAQLDGTTRDAVQNKNSQIMDPLFSKPGTKDRTPHLR